VAPRRERDSVPSSKPAPKRKTTAKVSAPKKKPATAGKPKAPVKSSKGSSAPKAKPAPKNSPGKPSAVASAPVPEVALPPPPLLGNETIRILSLAFVRDGDEFLARLESAGGHITELKNRSLDQLLTMVAGELEDLLA
jgi:hypothetical protein